MKTPLKAIKAKCLECSCYSPKEVKECVINECSLFPYWFGNNPKRKGVGNKNAFNNLNSNTKSRKQTDNALE